jgi:hypothetical protein
LTQSGHTLSSFDTVRYPVEIGLVEPKSAKRQCHRRCHIRYKFVTSRIEFVPMTGATIVVEFELMKAD